MQRQKYYKKNNLRVNVQNQDSNYSVLRQKILKKNVNVLESCSYSFKFKKLLFTMENDTAANSSQSNISRIYI